MRQCGFLLLHLAVGAHSAPACVSDDRLKMITTEQVVSRLREVARNPSTSWMMQQTVNPDASKVPQLKKIYYINLPSNAFRRGRVNQLLKSTSFDIPFERFDAVTRSQAKEADLKEFTDKGIASYMKEVYAGHTVWATVGIYLSHARLLKKILTENPNSEDMFLILEDDVIPTADWKQKFQEKLHHVPEDWDMLRIGYGTDSVSRCEDKVNEEVYENRDPTRSKDNSKGFYVGNTAYVVRPKSIPRIFKQLETMPVFDVDGAMMSHEGGMRVYSLAEPLYNHGNGIGFSDRMNPFSSFIQVEQEGKSLASIIDSSGGVQEKQDVRGEEKAFDFFAEDTPDL